MIWVPNQLVGAPAGTDVTVDCHTEAHPRAISYWVYDNVMVLPTKKYAINTEENSYRYDQRIKFVLFYQNNQRSLFYGILSSLTIK